MQATITLTNINEKTMDQVIVEDIKNKNDFSYLDNQNCVCHILVDKNDFVFFRKAQDHDLEIHVNNKKSYIMVSSSEGQLELNIKVIDFINFNDILEIRYVLDSEERLLSISYK